MAGRSDAEAGALKSSQPWMPACQISSSVFLPIPEMWRNVLVSMGEDLLLF